MKHGVNSMLLTVLLFGAGGCPSMDGSGTEREFEANLDGDQETPPVTTAATGMGTFTLNAEQTELSFRISASGLSGPIVGAHFHLGPTGESGPVVNDITAQVVEDDAGVTLEGTWEISAADLDDLLDENLYVNLHTEQNQGGEIRGQVEIPE